MVQTVLRLRELFRRLILDPNGQIAVGNNAN
jgi:hypothetical protein